MLERRAIDLDHILESHPSYEYETLTAIVDGKPCGGLSFYWAKQAKYWELEMVDVLDDMQGRGIGGFLIDAFAKKIGSNQDVHSYIVHEQSVDELTQKYKTENIDGSYYLPTDEISNIPIVKILGSGNIVTEQIRIAPNFIDPETIPYSIQLWGRTTNSQT